jgi:type VI secretion system protein VasJ
VLNRLVAALRREDAAVAQAPLSALLDDVARPIRGEDPCGEDVSYDADFLRLKEEIDKLNAVDTRVDQEKAADLARQLKESGSRTPQTVEQRAESAGARRPSGMDADFVIASAQAILRDKSKDLRVVSYLALALARRDGLAGVAEAAAAYALVVDSYWDGLYPPLKRMTGRKNAIEVGARWLLDTLDSVTPTASDREPLEQAREALSALTTAFATRELPDLVTRVAMLDAKLAELLTRVPASAPLATELVAAPLLPASPSNGATPNAASETVATNALAPQSAAQTAEMIIRAVAWMRQAEPRRPGAYRLARSLRWDALAATPPNQQHRTAIEAPPAARRDYLFGLHRRGAWADLLREAEGSFCQPPFHFWFDLQRLVVAALEHLGSEYAPARDAVVRELQLVIARLPGLPALLFADGRTRFADAATASWLEEVAKPTDAFTPNARDAAAMSRPTTALATRFAEPRKRFNDGDLAGALTLLQSGAAGDASQHDRFLRRLYSATLCLEGGQLSVARALLEELEEDIETHRLDRWDPSLALDVWTRLYACYSAQAGRAGRGGDVQQIGRDMQRVFARICRVDTARALAAAQEVGHPKS